MQGGKGRHMDNASRFRHLRHEGVRGWVESSEGQRALSFVHSWVRSALASTGAFRAGAAYPAFTSVWFGQLSPEHVTACLERLVQLGELAEVTAIVGPDADRVFTSVRAGANARHLSLVLVLTELEKAGKPITIDSLCARLEGERAQVDDLLRELEERGQVSVAGEWIERSAELTIHVVHEGRALCGKRGVPGNWGTRHKWVYRDHDGGGPRAAVNCRECRVGLIASGVFDPGSNVCTNPSRDCPRDGDCPVHGKDRPGQCVPTPTESVRPGGASERALDGGNGRGD